MAPLVTLVALVYFGLSGVAANDCNSDAVVGHCLITGCFNDPGEAHCDGTRLKDGWQRVPEPRLFPTPAPTPQPQNCPPWVGETNGLCVTDNLAVHAGACFDPQNQQARVQCLVASNMHASHQCPANIPSKCVFGDHGDSLDSEEIITRMVDKVKDMGVELAEKVGKAVKKEAEEFAEDVKESYNHTMQDIVAAKELILEKLGFGAQLRKEWFEAPEDLESAPSQEPVHPAWCDALEDLEFEHSPWLDALEDLEPEPDLEESQVEMPKWKASLPKAAHYFGFIFFFFLMLFAPSGYTHLMLWSLCVFGVVGGVRHIEIPGAIFASNPAETRWSV